MSDSLGVGLIGAGWMGHAHSGAWARVRSLDPDCSLIPRLVAAADTDESASEWLQRRWQWERVSSDWRSVVDDPNVEVVDICAPNSMHCEIASAAAAAGKHVYCEKPLGRSLSDARAMRDAVRRAGVESYVGFNYRWMPALQHARALAEEGRFGDITHFRSVFHTDWGADPMAPFSWRFDAEQAGWGALSDAGSHVIDMAEHIVGPLEGVLGTMATFITERPAPRKSGDGNDRTISVFGAADLDDTAGRTPVTNDDYAAALLRFASGARGTIEISRAINGPRSRFTVDIHGTAGAFSWDLERMNEYELWLKDDLPLEYGYRRVLVGPGHPDHGLFSPGPGVGIAFEDSKAIETYRFVMALAEGRHAHPDFTAGLRVAEVTHAVAESSRTETWVDVLSREGQLSAANTEDPTPLRGPTGAH